MSDTKLALGYVNKYTEQDVRMIVSVRDDGLEELVEQFSNFLVALSFPEQVVRSRLFPWEYPDESESKTS